MGIKEMQGALSRMPEGCHPLIFYQRVRPFLSGWKANPTLPDGVLYEVRMKVVGFWGNPGEGMGDEGGGIASILRTIEEKWIPRLGNRLRGYIRWIMD